MDLLVQSPARALISSYKSIGRFSLSLNVLLFLSNQMFHRTITTKLNKMIIFLFFCFNLLTSMHSEEVRECVEFQLSINLNLSHMAAAYEQCRKRWCLFSSFFLHITHQFGLRFVLGSLFWRLSAMLMHSCTRDHMKNLHFFVILDLHKFLKVYGAKEFRPLLSLVWMADFTKAILKVPCVFSFQVGKSWPFTTNVGVSNVELSSSTWLIHSYEGVS